MEAAVSRFQFIVRNYFSNTAARIQFDHLTEITQLLPSPPKSDFIVLLLR